MVTTGHSKRSRFTQARAWTDDKFSCTPIYQTTSHTFASTAHASGLFALRELGNIYTRIMNPTQAAVEGRRCAGRRRWCTVGVQRSGSRDSRDPQRRRGGRPHCVESTPHGGTYNLFHYTLPKLGIQVSFVENPDDPASWAAAVQPNTKAFLRVDQQPIQRHSRHRSCCEGRSRQ